MSYRILIIDDDEAVRDSLSVILSAMDYKVETARDGLEGLKKLVKCDPHIVLTDILMPGQEGIETIMQIRKLNPGIKIIAMSGGGQTSSGNFLNLAKKLGADHTLEKPFESAALADTIRLCLEEIRAGT